MAYLFFFFFFAYLKGKMSNKVNALFIIILCLFV